MLRIVKRKVIVCNICLGIGLNQLLLEYRNYCTEVVEQPMNNFNYREKLSNNKFKSVAKSSRSKKTKLESNDKF